MQNMKEIQTTDFLRSTVKKTLDYVATHRPVRLLNSGRYDIVFILSTDYEELIAENKKLKETKWISVDDRRPEMDRDGEGAPYEESSPEVICVDNRGNTKTLMYVFTKDEAYWFDFERYSESSFCPTHWMPLPARD